LAQLGKLLTWIRESLPSIVFLAVGTVLCVVELYAYLIVRAKFDPSNLLIGVALLLIGNLSQFKIIKFPGFEAERWDDTKNEARELSAKLRDATMQIRSQILELKVEADYLATPYRDKVDFYDDLLTEDPSISQNSTFLKAKKKFDWSYKDRLLDEAVRVISNCLSEQISAAAVSLDPSRIENKQNPAATNESYERLLSMREQTPRNRQREAIDGEANRILDWLNRRKRELSEKFGVTVELNPEAERLLRRIAEMPNVGAVEFEDDLVSFLDNRF
jgi:hypothetical protein